MRNVSSLSAILMILFLVNQSYGANETITCQSVADAQVTSANPNQNYGSATTATAGRDAFNDWVFVILARFDLSGIPTGAKIHAGELELYGDWNIESGNQYFGIWMADRSWNESSVNFNNWPGTISDSLVEFPMTGSAQGGNILIGEGMTSIAERWIENGEGNYGIIIGIPNTRPAGQSLFTIRTREASSSSQRPKLHIAYERTIISAPFGLAASDGTYPDRVKLQWNAVSNVDGYDVYRNTSNNSANAQQIFFTADPNSESNQDTDVTPGVTYYYWVTAINFIDGETYALYQLRETGS